MAELDPDVLRALDAALTRHVDDATPGAVWLVSAGDQVHVGCAGRLDDTGRPVRRDSIFRIASMTKPLAAMAALMLVDDGRVRLDDPLDPWLPELADRQVLRPGAESLDDTVPADRPISLRDLLTFRFGLGYDFSGRSRQLTLEPLAAAGLQLGPPAPNSMPDADRLMAMLGSVPLEHQPGAEWRYHFGAEVLGVLVERMTGRRLGEVIAERITRPLGMTDTTFHVDRSRLDRFGASYGRDPSSGERAVWDPADGHWFGDPPFHSGGGGLVSTIDDHHRFARCLLDGAVTIDGTPLLSPDLARAMTTDQLTADQRLGLSPTGDEGWGFGVGVQVGGDDPTAPVGSYGWSGGLGTMWRNDPARDAVVIVLTNQMFTDPSLPPVIADGFRLAFAALR
jgi:CubicO group peptidase (beta-lactamase class C family)